VKPSDHAALLPVRGVRAVFLVGFMGAGKTSVGEALAAILGWKFEDLDDRIAATEGRPIAQIFAERGEAGFREAERTALKSALQNGPPAGIVIALGGGAFVSEENSARLAEPGFVTIFLDAPVDELFRRCDQQDVARPMRQSFEDFCRLHAERQSAYRKASLRVETHPKQVDEVAKEIAEILNLG
jgi:shikimate kinase